MTSAAAVLSAPRARSERIRGAADRLLGRWTMYRVVLAVLAVLLAAAAVTGAAGITPFPPLAILAATRVAVVATLGATWLAALPFGVRPHTESSLITALLVFFLFFPVLDLRRLGSLALVGAVAGPSKTCSRARPARPQSGRDRRGRRPPDRVLRRDLVDRAPSLLPFLLIGGLLVLRRSGTWDPALPVLVVALSGSFLRLRRRHGTGRRPGPRSPPTRSSSSRRSWCPSRSPSAPAVAAAPGQRADRSARLIPFALGPHRCRRSSRCSWATSPRSRPARAPASGSPSQGSGSEASDLQPSYARAAAAVSGQGSTSS